MLLKVINQNSKLFSLASFGLILLSILQVAKSTIAEINNNEFLDINPWAFSDLLINYQGGFVRRGLIGEIVFYLDSDGILFDTVYKIIFFNFCIFVILILLNLKILNLNTFQKFLFHISIFGVFNMSLFGNYFAKGLDEIGSLYFSKEAFDKTYPGYGSSYADLLGGIGMLFEQASSRGHKQVTQFGEITFPFTIRNQYVSGMTTVKASVALKQELINYQRRFFSSAIDEADKKRIKGYSFNLNKDRNKTKAFIDKLLIHDVKVVRNNDNFFVPTKQKNYRIVRSIFETNTEFRDSVFMMHHHGQ